MTTRLVIEYAVYGGIIVLGLLVLGLMKRKNKLPNHSELRNRLFAVQSQIRSFYKEERAEPSGGYDFYKRVTKFIFLLDKLVYDTSMISEKERDVQIGNISAILEQARNEISVYKFNQKPKEDLSSILNAAEIVDKAIAEADEILIRDKEYKERKGKA